MISRKFTKAGFYLLLICLLFFCVVEGKAAVSGAVKGAALCVEVLIPSIFPFMVLSSMLVVSGFLEFVSRPAEALCRRIFKLPASSAGIFLIGIVSGFPSGAKAACDLYEKGRCTKSEAERIAAFCNNAGMGFVINSVGVLMFQSRFAGVILFFAQLLSALLSGYIISRGHGFKASPAKIIARKSTSLTQAVVDSVVSSANTMVSVCGFVIFFSVCSAMLFHYLPLSSAPLAGGVLAGALEITGGLRLISKSGSLLVLPLAGLITGWAGLSVLFQVAAVLRKAGLSSFEYIKAKLIQGPLCFILTVIFCIPFREEVVSCIAASCGTYEFDTSSYLSVVVCLAVFFAALFFKKCYQFIERYVKIY